MTKHILYMVRRNVDFGSKDIQSCSVTISYCYNFVIAKRMIVKHTTCLMSTSGWACSKTRLERLLGLSERHDFTLLSLRFERRKICGSHAKTFDHCGWCHYAGYSWTSQERLYFLLVYCIRRCILVSGNLTWKIFLVCFCDVNQKSE